MFPIVFDITVLTYLDAQFFSQLEGRRITNGDEYAVGFERVGLVCFFGMQGSMAASFREDHG